VSLVFQTSDGLVPALRDVSLSIAKGEFVSFIGPSGCGKTHAAALRGGPGDSHLRHAHRERPVAGRGAAGAGLRLCLPAAGLYPWRTIAGNIRLPLEIMGFSRAEQDQRVDRVLKLVDLEGFGRKYPWQLSGGMQQRASIARALAFDADILLMDEPFGALDEIVRDRLNEELLKLWARTGKTTLFVTHSIPEAVFLSTRIVVMSPRPGRITDVIDSPLPRERPLDIRESPEFLAVAHRVREGLRAGHVEV
jgi:NitT/TauT family transport system ATP-binding protein